MPAQPNRPVIRGAQPLVKKMSPLGKTIGSHRQSTAKQVARNVIGMRKPR